MAKIDAISIPKLIFAEGAAPSTPAANTGICYFKADGLMYSKDDAGVEKLMSSGPAAGISSGTSNPGSPSTGDLFHRTDLTPGIYRYNGTRWLCTCPHTAQYSHLEQLTPLTASGGVGYAALDNSTLDLWCTRIICSTTVVTTNNGTNLWTVSFTRGPSNTSLGSFSTGTTPDTAGTNTRHDVTVGALLGTSDRYVTGSIAKTLSPGGIYVMATLVYHYVAA